MNILYGVAGEGSGHAIRSKPIIEHLEKNHNVLVACGGRAYAILSKNFRTEKIISSRIISENNSVKNTSTFFYNLANFLFYIISCIKIFLLCRKFKPNIIISDFEPITSYYSIFSGKQLISIDNMHIITNADLEIKNHKISEIISKIVIHLLVPKADYYFITSFFNVKIKKKYKKNTFLFPPVLRADLLKIKPSKRDFILVYQTSFNESTIINSLEKIKEKFIVYGLDKTYKKGNIEFKKFNEKEFISNLASCKALICNGGFTTISEAISIKKPIFSMPIKKQFEQITNAYYVQKRDFGVYENELDAEKIKKFITKLPIFNKNLKNHRIKDNTQIFNKIDNILNDIKN